MAKPGGEFGPRVNSKATVRALGVTPFVFEVNEDVTAARALEPVARVQVAHTRRKKVHWGRVTLTRTELSGESSAPAAPRLFESAPMRRKKGQFNAHGLELVGEGEVLGTYDAETQTAPVYRRTTDTLEVKTIDGTTVVDIHSSRLIPVPVEVTPALEAQPAEASAVDGTVEGEPVEPQVREAGVVDRFIPDPDVLHGHKKRDRRTAALNAAGEIVHIAGDGQSEVRFVRPNRPGPSGVSVS